MNIQIYPLKMNIYEALKAAFDLYSSCIVYRVVQQKNMDHYCYYYFY